MRRKSERVSKSVVEKKPEKSPKKTRARSTRRRKKSASTSPESSDNEPFETALRSSQEDTEEEASSGTSRTRREKSKVVYTEPEVEAADLDDDDVQPKVFTGRTRRSSKKQTAEEAEDQAKSEPEDKSVDEAQPKAESSDQKHKEKEGKSSMWQVKSADCSSGEIKKLKLCIVRPQELSEQSPKKHKKNRSSRSSAHRELAESEAGESSARDSSGERKKNKRSHRHASASDDSTSPDKGKGKQKSGESSEDGHRTQDSSEEMVAKIVRANVEKPKLEVEDVPTEDEILSVSLVETEPKQDPVTNIRESSDALQEDDPLQICAETPIDESVSQSAVSSPDTQDDSSQSLDPFDKLTMEVIKPLERKKERSQEDIPTCDSTVQKTSNETKVLKISLDENNSECDSSVTPTVETSHTRDSSEERSLPKPGSTRDLVAGKNPISPHTDKSTDKATPEKNETHDATDKDCAVELHTADALQETSSAVKLKRKIRIEPENILSVSNNTSVQPHVIDVLKETSAVENKVIEVEPEVLELTAENVQLESEKDIREPCKQKSKDTEPSQIDDLQENKPRSRRLNRSATKDRQPIVVTDMDSPISDTVLTNNEQVNRGKTRERRKASAEVKEEVKELIPEIKQKDPEVKDVTEEKPVQDKQSKTSPRPRRSRVVWEEKPTKPLPTIVVEKKRLQSSKDKDSVQVPNQTAVTDETAKAVEDETPKAVADETPKVVIVTKPAEKVTLKRSRKACGDHENSTDVANNIANDTEPTAPRKRPWGSKNSSTAAKKPALSISSDSLKSLVPEAKPLPLSEVQLTPDEDEEDEGEIVDKDDETSPFEEEPEDKKTHGNEEVPAREHAREVKLIFPSTGPDVQRATVALPDESRGKTVGGRKISIISDELRALQRSPSPARHKKSDVLYITNLVRPFTLNQIKVLLARTGTLVEGGFWMDVIKSKCYVQYSSVEEAELTRKALHGVRWPTSNPKQLCVDYAQKEDMDRTKDLAEGNTKAIRKVEPPKAGAWGLENDDGDHIRDRERERIVREMEKIDREQQLREKGDHHERGMKQRVANIREWDLGKVEAGLPEDGRRSREDRNKEKERRLRKDRSHRSQSPQDVPARKLKKKEEDAPAKLLDDLFRKTKLTPCIYWLPLTAEQIVVKEEMRRKHMAEHERRLAEMRKVDKERLRGLGRPQPRRFSDRDKRSPKK